MNLGYRLRVVFIAIVLLNVLLVFTGNAQGSVAGNIRDSSDHPYISWVSQYPPNHDGGVKQSTARRIYDFLIRKNKETLMNRPVGVLAISQADFWVLDQGDEAVFQVQKNKAEIPRSIRKKQNYFTSLVGVCAIPGGSVLFTDSRLNKIFLLGEDQKTLTAVNDTLQLQQPTGIAYSVVTDEIWVVETNAHRISIISRNGELIKRVGSRGDGSGQFNFPTSICIDKNGDAYVVDAMNFRVEIFHKNGEFVSSFGEAGDGSGFFARPKGIAVDAYGNIYVADALFHAVQIFDRAGEFLYSFGAQGRAKGEFWMPAGIYIDNNNFIYVADSYNSRIQVFQLNNGS